MSTAASELNYHGRRLLRVLRRLREQNGLTQEEAAERAYIDREKLGRTERSQLPTYHELTFLLDAYGVPGCDRGPYVELWELAKQRPWWWRLDLDDVGYVRMEDEASRKFEFQRVRIPTLLQTEAYVRMTPVKQRKAAVADLIACRMRQQERLTTAPLLDLHALIYERVLLDEADEAQLGRLITLAELPNVTIQIVPHACLGAELVSSVCLLSFDDPDEPDSVFAESVIGLHETRNPDRTGVVRRLLRDAAQRAMSPEASLVHIQALRRQFLSAR
ncbi:hypothetical protein ALI144C_32020 [Actinosynnema sp. ALI-1.44]|uniref:Scr1 family TA system antitoxin-like transcriptional regulator n=1 Tax=Actinosynnema sp. ALI-1.44 TaxID=1933779 RepID=UPI00097C80C9|nr:Scr1 family TA system antitoxin-like transcriptional regulator [Actinosynnema sp. ALI-1.44]ONI78017.1 hypothetical protein ALI144C_32020 [Actinosynnema sp. ALI-1.44]